MKPSIDLEDQFIRVLGIGSEARATVRAVLTEQLREEPSKKDKLMLQESWIAEAVPCDVERPWRDLEEPPPTTTAALLAAHWSGLFPNALMSSAPGGVLDKVTYLGDTNVVGRTGGMPVYVGKIEFRTGMLTKLLPFVYLPSVTMRDELEDAWSKISELGIEDPTPKIRAKTTALLKAFVKAYPGVAHHARQLLLDHEVDEEILGEAPEPETLPPALLAVYEAFLELAPSFIKAKGLPKPGSAKKSAEKAATRLATISDFGDYESPRLLAELLIAWSAGNEAEAKERAETILSRKLGVPLTRRWAARILGREPTE